MEHRGIEKTFALLCKGETVGIFQAESGGMQNLLRAIQPQSAEAYIATIALFRPGALDSGQTDLFAEACKGVPVFQDDQRVKEILGETKGVLVYQEQVMAIARMIAGFTAEEADALRKAVAKKDPEKMRTLMEKFVTGAVKKGMDSKAAEKLAETIEHFGGYGFNKSHAAAYAFLSFQMAWIKANFQLRFWASRLSVEPSGQHARERFGQYLRAAKSEGVAVLPPDVNLSAVDFTVEGEAVRFGFAGIKGIGQAAAEAIVKERAESGEYKDVEDLHARFCKTRGLSITTMKVLARCGALDAFGPSRARTEELLKYLRDKLKRKQSSPPFQAEAPVEAAWDRIRAEFELLEAPLATPLESIFPPETELAYELIESDKYVRIGGRVAKVERLRTRHDKPYAKIRLVGAKSEITVMAFSECLSHSPEIRRLEEGEFVVAKGTLDDRFGTLNAAAVTILDVDSAAAS